MAESWKLAVDAGPHDRALCPVVIKLPHATPGPFQVALTDEKTRRAVPCQVLREGEDALLIWRVHGLKAGGRQALAARVIKGAPSRPGVLVRNRPKQEQVDISVGGELFTAYHYGSKWARPFFYPVRGPGGVCVTRHWPIKQRVKGEHRDHPRHKSLWVAYGECGAVDNWSEEPGHGWQRHQGFLALDSGPVAGRVTALNHWCYPDGRKQFEEVRTVCVYHLGAPERLLDVRVTFRMTEGPELRFYDGELFRLEALSPRGQHLGGYDVWRGTGNHLALSAVPPPWGRTGRTGGATISGLCHAARHQPGIGRVARLRSKEAAGNDDG